MNPAAVVLRKKLIDEKGRTVTQLAAELGIGRPAISNVLNGNAELSIALALAIERRFGVNARKLLRRQLEWRIALARDNA